MNVASQVAISGQRAFEVTRGGEMTRPPVSQRFRDVIRHALPFSGSREVDVYRLRNLVNIWRGLWRIMVAKTFGLSNFYGAVYATVRRANGEVIYLGLVSLRVVTDTGVGFIVDAFQNSVELENMKYHGFGTGSNAEAAGNTALDTELTTQYASDNTRPTGSTTEGATANIYRTVGTLSPDATVAITEHGIFSQAATGGGVLLDKSLFSAVNLVSGDSLQITFDLTLTSGG